MQCAPPREKDLIFVCGFARAGTSWLRDCVATHPEVSRVPSEIVYRPDARTRVQMLLARGLRPINQRLAGFLSFQNTKGSAQNGRDDDFLAEILDSINKHQLSGPRFVSKAPANSMHLATLCRMLPHSKFLFIIRDPRDVLVSHQRGNRQWMNGANSTVEGCMEKLKSYFDAYLDASGYSNLMMVQYEKLHQDFYVTMGRVFTFLGLTSTPAIVHSVYKKNNFVARTGRRNKEDPASPRRKGVIGDWGTYLSQRERDWYGKNPFWRDFLAAFGYSTHPLTYKGILSAMKEAGVRALDEAQLLQRTIDYQKVNLVLLHDMDSLTTVESRKSILRSAEIEGALGLASIFNFLPLDDQRYQSVSATDVLGLMDQITKLNSRAAIGLHFNAAERFFPTSTEDAGDDHPAMKMAVEYLHKQLDDYARLGVSFKLATAHGYGRGKKKPNNRDSRIFTNELIKRNVALFDNIIRPEMDAQASCCIKFTDVGGALSIREMPHAGMPDLADSYRVLPPGCLVRFLSHPGNYPIDRALALASRIYGSPGPSESA